MSNMSQDLLALFDDVIADTMFIGSSRADLAEEIRTNTWGIALSDEECGDLSTEDVQDLFARIIESRQQQLDRSNADHGMIFYLWFDEQALQLRFNLISDFHERLPFGCQLNILPNPKPILDRYLHAPYHEVIPWHDLKTPPEERNDNFVEQPFILDVYQLRLDPHQPIPSRSPSPRLLME